MIYVRSMVLFFHVGWAGYDCERTMNDVMDSVFYTMRMAPPLLTNLYVTKIFQLFQSDKPLYEHQTFSRKRNIMEDDGLSSQRPQASSGLDKNVSYWTIKEHLKTTLQNLKKTRAKHHRVIYWCDQCGSSEDNVKAREATLLERTEAEISKVTNLIEVISDLENGILTPDEIEDEAKKRITEINDQLAPAPLTGSPTSIHSRVSPRSTNSSPLLANRSANEDVYAAFEEMTGGARSRLESQREDAENENQEDEAEEEQENEEHDADVNAPESSRAPSVLTASPTASELLNTDLNTLYASFSGAHLPESDLPDNEDSVSDENIRGPAQPQDEQRRDTIEALNKTVEDQKAILQTFQAALEAQDKRMKDLERSHEGTDKQLEEVHETLEANDKKIEGLETEVGLDVGSLTATVNDRGEQLTELKKEIESMKEKEDELREALKGKDKKIEGLENDVASLTAQTKSGNEQVAELKGEIEKLKEAEAERAKTVDSLVAAYAKLSMQVCTALAGSS